MHWIDFHALHGIPTALVRFPYPCMEIHPIAPFLLDAAVSGLAMHDLQGVVVKYGEPACLGGKGCTG